MKLKVIKGDITTFKGDALVNAANTMLTGSGGLTAAIFRAAGSGLKEECEKFPVNQFTGVRCEAGNVVLTGGHRLAVKNIIHAVGPKWTGGASGEAECLRSLYTAIMQSAKSFGLKSIAIPSISTGHHGFPIHQASRIAIYAIARFLWHSPKQSVTFYVYSDEDLEWYSGILQAAKGVFADVPEWVAHINGPFTGEGKLTRRDCLTYECRNAGKVGKFKVSYCVDNYPYFNVKTKVNGMDFEAGHKHSFMVMNGGIRADAAVVTRYIPDELKYPVWLNGRPWKVMDKHELAEIGVAAEKRFWVTDPRFLFAACAALGETDKKISEVLSAAPTRFEAAEVLDHYHMSAIAPSFGESPCPADVKSFDSYDWMKKMVEDMQAYGAGFVAHVIG